MKSRVLLLLFAIAALGLLLLANRAELQEAWALAKETNILFLIIMVVGARAVSFFGLASYYKYSFEKFGYDIPLDELYKDSIATNFVNIILPSVGVSGGSWLVVRLKESHDVPYAITTLVQVGRYIFNFASFVLLLAVCLLVLLFTDEISGSGLALILSLMFIISTFVWLLAYMVSGRKRVRNLVVGIIYVVNFVVMLASFGKRKEQITVQTVQDRVSSFNYQLEKLKRRKNGVFSPAKYLLLFTVMESLSAYAVFIALGQFINPAKVIVAFGMGTLVASVFAFIPAGIGIYEATMTATLSALGLSQALSLTATLLYRAVFLLTLIVPGIYYYQRIVKKPKDG